jgi:hypothetical protein
VHVPSEGAAAAAVRAAFAFWSAALLTAQYDPVLQWLEAHFGVQVRVRAQVQDAAQGDPDTMPTVQAFVPFSQSAWEARTSRGAHVAGYIAVRTPCTALRNTVMPCSYQASWGPPATATGGRRARGRAGTKGRRGWRIVPCGGRTFRKWMQPSSQLGQAQQGDSCPVMHFVAALTLGLWDTVLAPYVATGGFMSIPTPVRVQVAKEVFRVAQAPGTHGMSGETSATASASASDTASSSVASFGGVMATPPGASLEQQHYPYPYPYPYASPYPVYYPYAPDADVDADVDADDDADDDAGDDADDDADDDGGKPDADKTAIRSVVINVYPGHAGPAGPTGASVGLAETQKGGDTVSAAEVVAGRAQGGDRPLPPLQTVTVTPADVHQASGNQDADSWMAALRLMVHLANTNSFLVLLDFRADLVAKVKNATGVFNDFLARARKDPALAADRAALVALRGAVVGDLRHVLTHMVPGMLNHKQAKMVRDLIDYTSPFHYQDFPKLFADVPPKKLGTAHGDAMP